MLPQWDTAWWSGESPRTCARRNPPPTARSCVWVLCGFSDAFVAVSRTGGEIPESRLAKSSFICSRSRYTRPEKLLKKTRRSWCLDVVYFHGNYCSLNKRSLQRMGPARSTLSQSQKENSCNLLRASPHVLSVLEDKHPNGINTETMGLSKRKRKAYTYEEFRLWAGSKELADHIWNTASPSEPQRSRATSPQ